MRFLTGTIILLAMLCGGCAPQVTMPEWKDQSLIFRTDPKASRGFVSVEEEDQTVTLTANLGTPLTEVEYQHIDIRRIPSTCVITEGRQDLRIGPIDIDKAGTHLYTAFSARSLKTGRISLAVYQHSKLAPGLLKVVEPGKEWKRYRFILRVMQPVSDITLRIQTDSAIEMEEVGALCKVPITNS